MRFGFAPNTQRVSTHSSNSKPKTTSRGCDVLMNETAYIIRLHPAEKGGFWVSCDEVPGALTQGEDVQDALVMMGEAMSLMLEDEEA
jgi:predicted RNase H-like HicB family nuclease